MSLIELSSANELAVLAELSGSVFENEATRDLGNNSNLLKTSGLLDLQVNGFAGMDFNTSGLSAEVFDYVLESMLSTGVTTFLATIITGTEAHLSACFEALEESRNYSQLAKSMVAGYHLEGPFLSTLPGYSGCHPVEKMNVVDSEMFLRLQESAGGNIQLVTLAPEVEGAIPFIEKLVRDGIVVALGHTAAGSEIIKQAVDAGALLSTHLGNGTTAELCKNNNPIIDQLAEDQLSASFIADGYHLSPEVLKVYLRAKESKRTILITDATAATSASPGRYRLGDIELSLGSEPVICSPETNRPVGSVVTLDQCVRNVMRWYDMPLKEAVSWAAENPMQLLKSSKAQTLLSEQEKAVWWEEHSEGWHVKAARSGKFLFKA